MDLFYNLDVLSRTSHVPLPLHPPPSISEIASFQSTTQIRDDIEAHLDRCADILIFVPARVGTSGSGLMSKAHLCDLHDALAAADAALAVAEGAAADAKHEPGAIEHLFPARPQLYRTHCLRRLGRLEDARRAYAVAARAPASVYRGSDELDLLWREATEMARVGLAKPENLEVTQPIAFPAKRVIVNLVPTEAASHSVAASVETMSWDDEDEEDEDDGDDTFDFGEFGIDSTPPTSLHHQNSDSTLRRFEDAEAREDTYTENLTTPLPPQPPSPETVVMNDRGQYHQHTLDKLVKRLSHASLSVAAKTDSAHEDKNKTDRRQSIAKLISWISEHRPHLKGQSQCGDQDKDCFWARVRNRRTKKARPAVMVGTQLEAIDEEEEYEQLVLEDYLRSGFAQGPREVASRNDESEEIHIWIQANGLSPLDQSPASPTATVMNNLHGTKLSSSRSRTTTDTTSDTVTGTATGTTSSVTVGLDDLTNVELALFLGVLEPHLLSCNASSPLRIPARRMIRTTKVDVDLDGDLDVDLDSRQMHRVRGDPLTQPLLDLEVRQRPPLRQRKKVEKVEGLQIPL